MKRIGLVTLYEADNFGTCLQAYALHKRIIDYGYECDIIRFDRNLASPQVSRIRTITSLGIRRTIDILLSKKTIQAQKAKFAAFRKKNYTYSKYLYSSIAEVSNADFKYDAFVTGSDMVWSWESRSFLDYYFLKFAKEGSRISYAPSFGNTNFTDEMKEYYSEAVRGIDYCSCREKKGQVYISDELNKKCILAADPTLLIPEKEWNALISKSRTKDKNVLIYMFGDIPEETNKRIKNLEKWGYKIRYIPQMHYQYLYEKKMGNDAFGPIEFLEAFRDSSFVITNTYHGLMFSLIYKKPFVMFHRDQGEHWNIHEERMQSVLETLNLQERYISFSDEIKEDYLKLDYDSVDLKLQAQIQQSCEFLSDSLIKATERESSV